MADKQEVAAANGDPIEVKTSSKSASDLTDEIAKAAANLGGESPGDKASVAGGAKEEVLETSVESNTEERKAEKIDVKSSKSVSDVLHGTVTDAPKEEVEEPDEESAVTHRGKTLTPIKVDTEVSEEQKKPNKKVKKEEKKKKPKKDIDESAKPASAVAKEKMTATAKPKAEKKESPPPKKRVEKEESETKPETPEKTESERKLDAMSGELRARENEKEAKKKDGDQHEAKIYDTKKYHLPIKANKHHRKSALPIWGQWLILAIAIGILVAYAYYIELITF